MCKIDPKDQLATMCSRIAALLHQLGFHAIIYSGITEEDALLPRVFKEVESFVKVHLYSVLGKATFLFVIITFSQIFFFLQKEESHFSQLCSWLPLCFTFTIHLVFEKPPVGLRSVYFFTYVYVTYRKLYS